MKRCWECETESGQTVAVVLSTSTGGACLIFLCHACYRCVYLPLTAHLMRGAPPATAIPVPNEAGSLTRQPAHGRS